MRGPLSVHDPHVRRSPPTRKPRSHRGHALSMSSSSAQVVVEEMQTETRLLLLQVQVVEVLEDLVVVDTKILVVLVIHHP